MTKLKIFNNKNKIKTKNKNILLLYKMFKVKSDAVKTGIDMIRLPCRNGLNFGQGNVIHWDIGAEVGFADLQNAFVECDINLNGSVNAPCAQLYRSCGASSVINRCTIRSQGRLLEELAEYNLYANLKYLASENQGILNKRSRLEGCAVDYEVGNNPYVTQNTPAASGAALVDINDTWRYVDRKVQIPLNCSGVFNKSENHPCMAIPLEVSLLLEKNARCMLVNAGDVEIALDNYAGGGPASILEVSDASRNKWGAPNVPGTNPTDAQMNQIANCPLRVGQRVLIEKTGGIGVLANGGQTNIVSIEIIAGGGFQLRFGNADGTPVNITTNDINGVTLRTLDANGLLFSNNVTADGITVAAQTLNYQVNNPRLVIPKVIPSPSYTRDIQVAISKGKYAMDIGSWVNYRQAIPGAVSNSTTIIPADLSRVKAILSVPVEQINLDAFNATNNIQGNYQGAISYVYQLNSKLVPDRNVNLSRETNGGWTNGAETEDGVTVTYRKAPKNAGGSVLDGVHCYEVEKALDAAGIDVNNLKFLGKTANVGAAGHQDGFYLVGRTTSAYGSSMNLMGISAILYLDYLDGTGNLKLLNNFVSHVRTIKVTPEGVIMKY